MSTTVSGQATQLRQDSRKRTLLLATVGVISVLALITGYVYTGVAQNSRGIVVLSPSRSLEEGNLDWSTTSPWEAEERRKSTRQFGLPDSREGDHFGDVERLSKTNSLSSSPGQGGKASSPRKSTPISSPRLSIAEALKRYGPEYHPALAQLFPSVYSAEEALSNLSFSDRHPFLKGVDQRDYAYRCTFAKDRERKMADQKHQYYDFGFTYLYDAGADSATTTLQWYPPASPPSQKFWEIRGYYGLGRIPKGRSKLGPLHAPFISNKATFWSDSEEFMNSLSSSSRTGSKAATASASASTTGSGGATSPGSSPVVPGTASSGIAAAPVGSCTLDDLGVLPLTFVLSDPERCRLFFSPSKKEERESSSWIAKPLMNYGGVGLEVFHSFEALRNKWEWLCQTETDAGSGSEARRGSGSSGSTSGTASFVSSSSSSVPTRYWSQHRPQQSQAAKRRTQMIIQEYMRHPALIHDRKFDLRIYLAIPRWKPLFVFFGGGFVRRGLSKYDPTSTRNAIALTNTHQQVDPSLGVTKIDPDRHIWSLKRMGEFFEREAKIAREGWFTQALIPEIRKALRHFVLTRRERVENHLYLGSPADAIGFYGQDFMITDTGRPIAIESNQFPALMSYTASDEDRWGKRRVMRDYLAAVHALHNNCLFADLKRGKCSRETPAKYGRMTEGDFFGGLELVYSERQSSPLSYDPCREFEQTNKADEKEGGVFQNFPSKAN